MCLRLLAWHSIPFVFSSISCCPTITMSSIKSDSALLPGPPLWNVLKAGKYSAIQP